MKKKRILRVFICIIVLIMTLSFISPSLVALADAGAGGCFSGGGGSVSVADNPINDEDIGLRFSLVTKDASGNTRVVQNVLGTYYVDIWDGIDSDRDVIYYKDSWYGAVNAYSRYSPNPTAKNITACIDSDFDATINDTISRSGKGSVKMNMSSILNVGGASASSLFTESEGGLKINGDLFYRWSMEQAGTYDGESHSRYYFIVNALYRNKLNGVNMKNTFLVVEPVLHIANPTDDGSFALTGEEYIASWYGYVEGNLEGRGVEPGCSFTLRDRFSNIANGFKIKKTEHLTDEMSNKMNEVLGVYTPSQEYLITGDLSKSDSRYGKSIAYGNGRAAHVRREMVEIYDFTYRYKGYAMQIFWLKDIASSGDPIDTYDIIKKQPNTPYYPESPDQKNNTTGEKTIIKLYTDAYVDPNTGLYTRIEDTAEFAMTGVSDKVTITDESKINGYEVKAWYLSTDAYSSTPKALSMMSKTDFGGSKTDGTVSLSSLGGQQLRVEKYINATGYNINGSKSYFAEIKSPHGPNGNGYINNTGLSQYTKYKRQDTKVDSDYGGVDYKKNDNQKEVVEFGSNDKTIVILYCREHIELSTGDYSSSTTITPTRDKRNDKSGNLKIVKLYGVINENTYEITNDPSKSKVVISNATRNVNLNSEDNYALAEWIYTTGGAGTGITAEQMGKPNLSQYMTDGSADQAYRLDGFVDGFKNSSVYSDKFRFKSGNSLKMPSIYTIAGSDGLTSATTPGRYSTGSRSGIGSRAYNSTIYFGGDGDLADETSDDSDTNDVLYMLFLKTDQLSYSTDDLVIPQSYVTRYDNYKHNAMKVTGSVSQTTYNEYLQNHKFKYLLPVVNNKDYEDVNPLFIGQIAIKDKLQSGLIPKYSSVERLEYHGATNQHEILKGYVASASSTTSIMSDYIQLLYIDHNKAITSSNDIANLGNILNLSAVNLEYTAYRSGDAVTAALWKYNSLVTASGGNKRLATDTGALLENFTTGHIAGLGSAIKQTNFNTPMSTRQENNKEQNFTLNFNFSEVGNGIKNAITSTNLKNLAYAQNIDSFKMQNVIQQSELTIGNTKLKRLGNSGMAGLVSRLYLNDKGKETKRALSQAFCNKLPSGFEKYSINSLNRLYKIKVNGTWKYAVGTTQYLNAASDISITQNVKYGVHYGSAIANPYKDDTKQGNSTDKLRQSGYVKSMKASNTISFYPYYVMQYELPSTYNAQLNKNGTKNNTAGAMNNANQLYVIGEEKRYLNVYNYAEVSFSGHTVSSSKGTDIVNNIVNSNRSGRIEISSEQWSTHARANSLIGLDNCALPGGATLSITIPNDNRQTVTITSYGAFLPEQSAGYAQVKAMQDASAFGTMPTNTDAIKSRHNSLVGSVVAGFEGLNVEQYFTDTKGYTNTKDHGSTYDSANTVYNQISGELGSGKNLYDLPESKRYSVKII